MKSEFPETKLTRLGKKLGWLFSPLLFISLLTFTIFSVNNIRIDFNSAKIEEMDYIHLRDVSNFDVYLDDNKIGTTSQVLALPRKDNSSHPFKIYIKTNDNRYWEKTIKFQKGFVSVYYPILYPQTLDFKDQSIEAKAVYPTSNPNVFFYEKIENNRLMLYRYSISRLIFRLNIKNEQFIDLTSILKPYNVLRPKKIIPSHLGTHVAIIIPKEKIYIIQEDARVSELPGYIPHEDDEYYWSPDNSYFVIQNNREILSRNISTNTTHSIYKQTTPEERASIHFCAGDFIVYSVIRPENIDLVQNTYFGNNPQQIDIPNFDNIRRNNLLKAYNFLKKQNIILIQTETNIYTFNLANYELRKFNLYPNEKIVYLDSDNQVILTNNTLSPNQFRYYNLDRNENTSFSINGINHDETPARIIGYNYSQNLFIEYSDKLILSDINGENQKEIAKSTKLDSILTAIKENRGVLLGMIVLNQQIESPNKLLINIEIFDI
jgi:hypothetical protein